MIGTRSMPKIVLVVIQTNPFMENIDQIKLIFDLVIDDLVCNCWEDLAPSEIKTVSRFLPPNSLTSRPLPAAQPLASTRLHSAL